MNVLEIKDLQNGKIQVSWQGAEARTCPPIPFSDPLTVEDRRELRWYLEEYLLFPYGAERDHAHTVEEKMEKWGESLFDQVFPHCDFYPDPQLLYHEAVREELDNCELCITSDNTEFLNIPWELLRDPVPGRGYLAPLLGGLYRKRESHKIVAPSSPEGPFRILLVIARPRGEEDVPLQTVARPVLEALRPLRKHIELEVLRPPTFDELVKKMHKKRGYYNAVHFDGHGVFSKSDSLMFGGGSGYLVFEKKDGTEHVVSSKELGQELATCRVPLFVLNACQSAKEGGKNPYSSVASQLVAVGAKGVVAMSYSVYSIAAAKFMKRFYENLIECKSLSEAVAAGRRKLHADPYRESVVGELKLRDWIVPCLYQQEQYTPIPEGTPESEIKDTVYQVAKEVCPEGRFGFVGRDYNILEIERALVDDETPWVLITGVGGCGKTALAYGFARWYAETGGCPGGVFVCLFKEKADFGQVVGSIAGFGTDFSRFSGEEQWELIVNYLHDNSCLLIWDNFEPVAGYPEGTEPLASQEEQNKLSEFLKALKGGKSRVLITTRKLDEDWLDIAYRLIPVKGLIERDSGKLAESILRTVGKRPENFRDDPQYSRLLTLLKGHPRSLEVVLPHLRDKSPTEIIEGLQHHVDGLRDVLDASLAYVFPLLSEKTQKFLPLVGLFTSYVNEDVVYLFSKSEQFDYKEIMSELPDFAGWKAIFRETKSVGLIRSIGSGIYELHPTFPLFLRQKLASLAEKDDLNQLDSAFMEFYGGLAVHFFEGIKKGNENALLGTAFEEANLLRALHLAEVDEQWEIAQVIVEIISLFYEIRGRFDEGAALRKHVLSTIDHDISINTDRDQVSLWMFLLGEEANSALNHNELKTAESAYKRILDCLVSLNDSSVEWKIAGIYHNLGAIAQERQQLDEAEQWYGKALEIKERLGLERYAATTYNQLGIVARERGQFGKSEQWYRKALEIYEKSGLERDAADVYTNLGAIAQERQQLEEAEQWYGKALEIYEKLGLEQHEATIYHHLGIIAEKQRQLDEAERWHRKALKIREQLGLENYAKDSYNELGLVAEEQGQFSKAEQWYCKSLEVCERLGLERDAAHDYYQLAIIAKKQQQYDKAEQRYRKALEVFERIGHPPSLVKTLAAIGLLYRQQNLPSESVEWLGKALKIASEYQMSVGLNILVELGQTSKNMGEKEFKKAWQEAFNEDPPLEAIEKIMKELEKGN